MVFRILALDVDGVLTDGGIFLSERGEEILRFSVVDGMGIIRWLEVGGECVWVSARRSAAMTFRAQRLGVHHVLLGVADKRAALEEFLARGGYTWDEVVYVGDDLVDLEPMMKAGLGVAVASAIPKVKAAAAYVTAASGGRGAVREVVEMLLDSTVRQKNEAAQEAQKSDGCGDGTAAGPGSSGDA